MYIPSIIALNVLLIICWVWLAILKYREHRSWHIYGCVLYIIGFGALLWRNIEIWEAMNRDLPDHIMMLSYAIYLIQLSGAISFIFNSYHRDYKH